ncbi:MAG: hypothetical protein U9N77_08870 [Thermodesulfobacteriota bacterium]|nr:hypothetical protein [Thermodesulfobacteriota bacterium]
MQELTGSQRARLAIREFKTIANALAIRGFYRPSGRFGKALEGCLRDLRPEIYGSMNDPKIVELEGLEYVTDRLPEGIEKAVKIILTDEEQFEDTPFEKLEPLKRRRSCYRINDKEFCFIISRGLSEIYDILTHMAFLNIEAKKIYRRTQDDYGKSRLEWTKLEKDLCADQELSSGCLDSALWNLSIILGRTYHETRETFESFEQKREKNKSNNGFFSLIYNLGKRIENEHESEEESLVVYLTPSLMNIIGHQRYGKIWALDIKEKLLELQLQDRPVHIVSANLHSVVNMLYGYGAVTEVGKAGREDGTDLYSFFAGIKKKNSDVLKFAESHGLYQLEDGSGTNIDCQIIDTAMLEKVEFHPELNFDIKKIRDEKPVVLVMDYAFGAQAFEVMEQLLKPILKENQIVSFNIGSISIMGKAGILAGEKGDIMLATAHVCEGSSDNYIVENDLVCEDFDKDVNVYAGPMATVLGTSLQNRDVLKMFQADWNAVGLEMEGGYYQKAVSAAIIKGNLSKDVSIRYAYYASDNPLMTGNTLAAGAMGEEGIKPTYMITKVILEKIFKK